MSEQWKAVPEYEGVYEVSDQGRVRRIARRGNTYPGRLLKPFPNRHGYLFVNLRDNGRRSVWAVHRIVGRAFLGKPSEINHKDGDKENNAVSNLEPSSRSHNMEHAHRTGLTLVARKKRKLSYAQAQEIRRKRKGGAFLRELAAEYVISTSSVRQILNNKTYRVA